LLFSGAIFPISEGEGAFGQVPKLDVLELL